MHCNGSTGSITISKYLSPFKGNAEIIIDRNRYGRTGIVALSFSGTLNSFNDFDYSTQNEA
jgi:replicative DNA helicase